MKNRNYTFAVDTHKRNLEIHATGCRDLAHLPPGTIMWSARAESAKAAVLAADLPESAKSTVKINACCAPVRMDAAGRFATADPVAETAAEPVAEEQAAFDAQAAGEGFAEVDNPEGNPNQPDVEPIVADTFESDGTEDFNDRREVHPEEFVTE